MVITKSLCANGLVVCVGILAAWSVWGCLDRARLDRRPAATPAQGVFYPPAPDKPRLQFLTSYSSASDLSDHGAEEPSGLETLVFGKQETAPQWIAKPYGLDLYDGKLYVCDVEKKRVTVLDLRNRTFGYLSEARRMTNPVNICIVAGTKYIADPTAGKVFVYGVDDALINVLGESLEMTPIDVEVRGQRCYITDMKNNQVVVLDIATGEVLRRMGKAGDAPGQFVLIGDLAVDDQGNVLVTDKMLGRVTEFDSAGDLKLAFGQAGRSIHHFVRPKGIEVDREGRIWVVDAAPEVTKIYDREGALLMFFGFPGNRPGNMNLPASVCLDYEHVDLFTSYAAEGAEIEFLAFVSNQYGTKINVYGFGHFPHQEKAIEDARLASLAAREEKRDDTAAGGTGPVASTIQTAEMQRLPADPFTNSTDREREGRMQEIAGIYYRSMHLYRIGQYAEAREGLSVVLHSGLIPPAMAVTVRSHLAQIDQVLPAPSLEAEKGR